MSWQDQPTRNQPIQAKKSFVEHYKQLLGADYQTFMDCNNTYLRRAIRINPLKTTTKQIKEELTKTGWQLIQVPWCKEAFWIQGERLDVGNLLAHQLGEIYIQDPASMLPPIILQPKPGERVLDMCASPGSKTTQAAGMMQNTGVIIANEPDGTRIAALGVNTQRLGVTNTLIVQNDGRALNKYEFDKIMIDAPCSGTGTLRRSLKPIQQHNINKIRGYQRLQEQLLKAGYDALTPGGSLTYSTCSLEVLENECVLSAFLNKNPEAQVHDIELDIKREKPFTTHPDTGEELHADVQKALRIHPYTNDTEGFFVTRISKPRT